MKKMRKAIFLLAISTLLIFSLLIFGAWSWGKKKQIVVKTMAYGTASNPEGVSWMRIVKEFEDENPNIKIDFEMLYDEAYHQKVIARIAAGDVPDLAFMGADARWGKPWAEAGLQYDHKPIMDKSFYDLNLVPPMGSKGEIWEIPLGTSNICTVLYMNEDLVKSLGFSEPKTYEDLVAMVPKAKAKGLQVVSIDGADGWAWGSCFMSAIIARLSGDANWVSKATEGKYKFTDKVFVDALSIITKMVNDGVIDKKSVLVDYGKNLSIYSNEQSLFMIQGQWIAGSIEAKIADKTRMLAFPKLPGEKSSMAGSVAAAIQTGYGITKKGASNKKVRDAAAKFLKFYYSEKETTQRLRDGAIVAPILKNYEVPADMPRIVKEKVVLAKSAKNTDVIDAFLSGSANDTLNAGMQKICSGTATAQQVAAEVEKLWRNR